MASTISKHIGEGFARGELYAALAYDTTDQFSGMRIKGIYITKTITVAAQRAFQIATTCALTSGSIKSVEIAQTNTADSTGDIEVLKVQLTSNVKTGTWVNAIFGRVNYTEDGWAYGSASAVCGEVSLAPGGSHSGQGTYACFQAELDVPASAVGIGAECSFFRASVWGNQKARFDTSGYLFVVTGITETNHGLFQTNTTVTGSSHSLKIKIGTTDYFIPLHATSVSD